MSNLREKLNFYKSCKKYLNKNVLSHSYIKKANFVPVIIFKLLH